MSLFISYHGTHTDAISMFCDKLESHGYEVFRDANKIVPGEEWWWRICQEIKECDDFLLVLWPGDFSSPEANNEWVHKEIGEAIREHKRITPVVFRPSRSAEPFNLDREREALPDDLKQVFDIQAATIKLATSVEYANSIADLESGLNSEPNAYVPPVVDSRFAYNSAENGIALHGYEEELACLSSFCDDDDRRVSWLGICGMAGVGKSKLSFELFKSVRRNGWSAHYCTRLTQAIEDDLMKRALERKRDMLICIDDAKFHRDFVESLVDTAAQYGGNPFKLRILLVDRARVDIGEDDPVARGCRFDAPGYPKVAVSSGIVSLKGLDAQPLAALIKDYINQNSDKDIDNPSLRMLVERHLEIDPEGKRPLYAMFIADAWCDGQNVDRWSTGAAMEYVCSREVERLSREVNTFLNPGTPMERKRRDDFIRALKLAISLTTYMGGVDVCSAGQLTAAQFGVDIADSEYQPIVEALGLLAEDGRTLRGIGPDLLGEYYCIETLDHLASDGFNDCSSAFFTFAYAHGFLESVRSSDNMYNDYPDRVHGAAWEDDMRYVVFPEEYHWVARNLFRGCGFLKGIDLHPLVRLISAGAFRDCDNLEEVVIPTAVETIGTSAFGGCTSLKSVLPADGRGAAPSVHEIKRGAFKGCTSLTTIILPNTVQKIGISAFERCESLEFIRIPMKVTAIETETFSGCTSLKNVIILSKPSVSIGTRAFYRCEHLEDIRFSENPRKGQGQICQLSRVSYIGERAFWGCSRMTHLELSSKLKGLGQSFARKAGLVSVDMSACTELTELPASSFAKCDNLAEIKLPANARHIGDEAFEGCVQLNSLSLPPSVSSLGKGCLSGCKNLTTLGDSRAPFKVGANALFGCSSLGEIAACHKASGRVKLGSFTFSSFGSEELRFLTTYAQGVCIEVPSTVLAIGDHAFRGMSDLEEVVLPAGVTSIGESAFAGCSSLVKVEVKGEIVRIGSQAFKGCRSLETIRGKLSLAKVEDRSFEGCSSLRRIALGNRVGSIGARAFAYCTQLRTVEYKISLSSGYTTFSIGASAFLGCDELSRMPVNFNFLRNVRVKKRSFSLFGLRFKYIGNDEIGFLNDCSSAVRLKIPKTCVQIETPGLLNGNPYVTEINVPKSIGVLPARAFASCEHLEKVTLPNTIKVLPKYVFANCPALKCVTFDGCDDNVIPDDVNVMEGAFAGCSSLESLSLPRNVRSVKEHTFRGCTSLASIRLPETLETIGMRAFNGCVSLKEIEFPDTLEVIGVCAFDGSGLSDLRWAPGSSLREIGDNAFQGCNSLEAVKTPNRLERIGCGAFRSCHQLESVFISSGVTDVGTAAFQECYSLKEVVLPRKVTRISACLCKSCGRLQKVVILGPVENIGGSAFFGCRRLTSIELPEGVAEMGTSAFDGCAQLPELEIPSSVEVMRPQVFRGCISLRSVRLPERLKKIPVDCFKGCESLEEVSIGSEVTEIGAGAFRFCLSLKSISLPEGLEQLMVSAFMNCQSLEGIDLPKEIRKVDHYMFMQCSNLKRVGVSGEDLEFVGNFAFEGCSKLEEFPLSKVRSWIGIASFMGCSSLGDIAFSQTLRNIDSAAFRGCTGLQTVSLPMGVKRVNGAVFRDDVNLRDVHLPSTIEVIGKSAFRDCSSLVYCDITSDEVQVKRSAFRGCSRLYDISIPKGSIVASNAFDGCPVEAYVANDPELRLIGD